MFLLGTNVISELMKPEPSFDVLHWIEQQPSNTLYISTVTVAEISYGLGVLPEGHRRKALEKAFKQTISEAFENQILSFDELSAHLYGQMMSKRKRLVKPMSILDGQIAAIAATNELAVVTLNARDFIDCGLALINPFER